MGKHWWETSEYQLKTGHWVPRVDINLDIPRGISTVRLEASDDRTFDDQAKAKAASESMAKKWLAEIAAKWHADNPG